MKNYIDTYIESCEHASGYKSAWVTTMKLFIPPRFPYLQSLIRQPGEPEEDKGSYALFSLPLEVHVGEHRENHGLSFGGIRFYGNPAEDYGKNAENLERIRTAQKITHTMYYKGTIYRRLVPRVVVAFDKDEETITFDAESMKVLTSRLARLMETLKA